MEGERVKPLDVPCSYCNDAEGKGCVSLSRYRSPFPVGIFHRERIRLAKLETFVFREILAK